MTTIRTFRCDLCRDMLTTEPGAESNRAIGLWWQSWPKGWLIKAASQAEHHICPPCMSSIQALPAICGHGYDCTGGPQCGSDHK